ncbi:MAG: hypothetical protein K0B81_00275 [Candidatus Cloacimonetes bacterium]|nr:hypothetical protein [Candidatus Cloacimonadota bacterium]
MVKFYWKKALFNITTGLIFVGGIWILHHSGMSKIAIIGIALIGISAAIVGYYGKQYGGDALKFYKKDNKENIEED